MGAKWKLPAIEKIPEAYSAAVSGRVTFPAEGKAEVLSSDSAKTYHVRWDDTGYDSDDNGSKWQGYAGYPILAVLILQHKLPADPEIMKLFANIDWTSLNKQFKRDYTTAVNSVIDSFPPEVDRAAVRSAISNTYEALKSLALCRRGKAVSVPVVEEVPLPPLEPFPEVTVVQRVPEPEKIYAVLEREGIFYLSADGKTVITSPALPEEVQFIGYNTKAFLRTHPGTEFIFDGMLAAWLLSPGEAEPSLSSIAEKYLRKQLSPDDTVKGCAALFLLKEVLEKALENAGLLKLFREIELPLAPVLAEMETKGIRFDEKALPGYSENLASLAETEKNSVFAGTGENFNLNSPKQLGEVLFVKLGLPAGKKTKSGWSTDMDVLENLTDKHPCIEHLIKYRKIEKLRSTYADVLPGLVQTDGRIHTTFNMTSTATGRLSSASPNLQNIPVRSEMGGEIRKMFLPAPGNLLISADYSQIELRLLAHISGDEVMIEAFRSGEDIHRVTASQVFGIPMDQVTPEQRRNAKAVNFGIVYGISAFALSRDLGISRKEAADYIAGYMNRYQKASAYLKNSVERAKKLGYAETIFGRKRYLPELASSNAVIRAFGERAALNAPIQGSSADIIKIAMIRVDEMLKKEFPGAFMILQIHDELILDCPESLVPAVSEKLKNVMESAVSLSVPLIADVSSGPDWYSI